MTHSRLSIGTWRGNRAAGPGPRSTDAGYSALNWRSAPQWPGSLLACGPDSPSCGHIARSAVRRLRETPTRRRIRPTPSRNADQIPRRVGISRGPPSADSAKRPHEGASGPQPPGAQSRAGRIALCAVRERAFLLHVALAICAYEESSTPSAQPFSSLCLNYRSTRAKFASA